MGLVSVERYSERQACAARRVLDLLDRCEARLEDHYSRVRRHERKGYRSLVQIRLPQVPHPAAPPPDEFRAWARNISQGGLSFIHPCRIAETRILVGLPLADGESRWCHGQIVRSRELSAEGFWEYGVSFRGLR